MFFRPLLIVPHYVVLFFVFVGGASPPSWRGSPSCSPGHIRPSLYGFGVGALRWRLRVEAYTLLLVDEYPPFSLR